ncbi:MAG: tetratricopeptide repeat protein [Flavobacteriales bacterium]|nr:tetratricopeptide repeat protein [Flavobacteriales bacterium]
MWRNLPPPEVAVLTFFVCGFVIVYLLGSRGFCFQACPYGALFGIADQLAPGRIVLTKDCSQCGLCTKACSSDILVHRELAQHGMVTNPRCLKDLDCVTACPEKAVRFGFRMPPLFRKGHPMGAYGGRFSTSVGEDLFMAIGFLIAMPVYRGLYDMVPFLLAVALALCTAWLFVLGWRLLRKSALQFRGITLKMDRSLRPGGYAFSIAILLVVLFFVHSALVQAHTLLGKRVFALMAAGRADARNLNSAIWHYESALRIGLLAPVDRRFELASLFNQAGDRQRSEELLRGVLDDDPSHAEARFRLGELALARGDREQAMRQWNENLTFGKDQSGTRSREMLTRSALALGAAHEAVADLQGASAAYARGLTLVPDDADLLVASGALAHRSGRMDDAVRFFDKALRNGAPEPQMRNNLAALHMQQGHLEFALPHLERLVALDPNDARLRYTLGALHARMGSRSKAVEHWSVGIQLDPADERTRQALAALQPMPSNEAR